MASASCGKSPAAVVWGDAGEPIGDAEICQLAREPGTAQRDLRGLFHLVDANAADAFNVVFDSKAGVFLYAVSGCDYTYESAGLLTKSVITWAHAWELTPRPGAKTFGWPDPDRGLHASDFVKAEATVDQDAVVIRLTGSKTGVVSQRWEPGGLCSVCQTSKIKPCAAPYAGELCQ